MSTDAIINTYSYIYDTNWKDQLINYNGNTITYDEIGNPLTYGNNITYTWINGRELSTYTDTSNNLEVTYSYNDEGIRTSKIINGVEHKYYLEGTNIIYETIGEETLYYFYDANGSIEGFKYNNDLYYYIKNGQNDIIGIIDDAGNKVVSYTYDSWGKIISITDNQGNEITDPTHIGNINPFRYRSYYYDSETGLYYLNSRYYNPEVGRFINSDDPSVASLELDNNYNKNLYAYTDNNPINRIDVQGQFWQAIMTLVASNPIVIAVTVIAVAVTQLPVVKEKLSETLTAIVAPVINATKPTIINPPNYGGSRSNPIPMPVAGPIDMANGLGSIAKGFGYGLCISAAIKMQQYLQNNNQKGAIVTVTFSGFYGRNYVLSASKNIPVGDNGIHMGVLWNGKIYCNIHPFGLPEQVWINDFIGLGTKTVDYKRF